MATGQNRSKTTHLIDEYKPRAGTILCICGWFGGEDLFKQHQKDSPPTSNKLDMNRFKGVFQLEIRPPINIYEDFVRND